MKREMNWKDELPQEICDFFDGKNNETRISEEEEQEIRQQQEVLRKMSEAFYEGLDISRAFENENSKKKENQDIYIKTKLLPPDKLEEYREFTLFLMKFSGIWLGAGFWVLVRLLLSFSFIRPNRLTDILSFFPAFIITKENVKNWMAGERTFSWFSTCLASSGQID